MYWIILFIFVNGTGPDKVYKKVEFPVPMAACFNIPEQMNKDPRYFATCTYKGD